MVLGPSCGYSYCVGSENTLNEAIKIHVDTQL